MTSGRSGSPGFYARYGKRLVDVAVSAAALLILSPVLLGTSIAVRASLGAPVLFRQVRPGIGERKFVLVKFRTMREAVDADGNPLCDSERLTPLGTTLRRWSLDELPELWNVLRGDMSLVGPRPLLPQYSAYYTPTERRRFLVRPGITGLAQVRGRNDLPWDERFAYDVWYVDNCSFQLDVRIVLATFGRVIARTSAHPDSRAHRLDFDVERQRRRAAIPSSDADLRR